jgi:hypothetical protein
LKGKLVCCSIAGLLPSQASSPASELVAHAGVYAANYSPRLQQLMLKRDDRLAVWVTGVAYV